MNLELVQIINVSERFYGKQAVEAVNDRTFNPDGSITYEAVEGFISPLKTMAALARQPEQEPFEKRALFEEKQRDVDPCVYTDIISTTLISKILIDKYQRNLNLREIYFAIKNERKQVSIHARIRDGIIQCIVSTASDKLRKYLNLGKRGMIISIRDALHLSTYVTVTDEIVFGRI